MNHVHLIGRLTKNPEESYTASQMAVCKFNVAVNRITKPDEEKKADFPHITVFGKQAENCARFLKKGSLVAIIGRLQTGSYQNKDGQTVFTTDVIAERVEFLSTPRQSGQPGITPEQSQQSFATPEGFGEIEDDIPF